MCYRICSFVFCHNLCTEICWLEMQNFPKSHYRHHTGISEMGINTGILPACHIIYYTFLQFESALLHFFRLVFLFTHNGWRSCHTFYKPTSTQPTTYTTYYLWSPMLQKSMSPLVVMNGVHLLRNFVFSMSLRAIDFSISKFLSKTGRNCSYLMATSW